MGGRVTVHLSVMAIIGGDQHDVERQLHHRVAIARVLFHGSVGKGG